jgi:hypothetical protein
MAQKYVQIDYSLEKLCGQMSLWKISPKMEFIFVKINA